MADLSFEDYLRAYRRDHQHPINRACHLVAIPMIVASLLMLPFAPRTALRLFGAGWALQFIGHAFEGKRPSFTRDLRYLAIGPVWVAAEWVELLTGKQLFDLDEAATLES